MLEEVVLVILKEVPSRKVSVRVVCRLAKLVT